MPSSIRSKRSGRSWKDNGEDESRLASPPFQERFQSLSAEVSRPWPAAEDASRSTPSPLQEAELSPFVEGEDLDIDELPAILEAEETVAQQISFFSPGKPKLIEISFPPPTPHARDSSPQPPPRLDTGNRIPRRNASRNRSVSLYSQPQSFESAPETRASSLSSSPAESSGVEAEWEQRALRQQYYLPHAHSEKGHSPPRAFSPASSDVEPRKRLPDEFHSKRPRSMTPPSTSPSLVEDSSSSPSPPPTAMPFLPQSSSQSEFTLPPPPMPPSPSPQQSKPSKLRGFARSMHFPKRRTKRVFTDAASTNPMPTSRSNDAPPFEAGPEYQNEIRQSLFQAANIADTSYFTPPATPSLQGKRLRRRSSIFTSRGDRMSYMQGDDAMPSVK